MANMRHNRFALLALATILCLAVCVRFTVGASDLSGSSSSTVTSDSRTPIDRVFTTQQSKVDPLQSEEDGNEEEPDQPFSNEEEETEEEGAEPIGTQIQFDPATSPGSGPTESSGEGSAPSLTKSIHPVTNLPPPPPVGNDDEQSGGSDGQIAPIEIASTAKSTATKDMLTEPAQELQQTAPLRVSPPVPAAEPTSSTLGVKKGEGGPISKVHVVPVATSEPAPISAHADDEGTLGAQMEKLAPAPKQLAAPQTTVAPIATAPTSTPIVVASESNDPDDPFSPINEEPEAEESQGNGGAEPATTQSQQPASIPNTDAKVAEQQKKQPQPVERSTPQGQQQDPVDGQQAASEKKAHDDALAKAAATKAQAKKDLLAAHAKKRAAEEQRKREEEQTKLNKEQAEKEAAAQAKQQEAAAIEAGQARAAAAAAAAKAASAAKAEADAEKQAEAASAATVLDDEEQEEPLNDVGVTTSTTTNPAPTAKPIPPAVTTKPATTKPVTPNQRLPSAAAAAPTETVEVETKDDSPSSTPQPNPQHGETGRAHKKGDEDGEGNVAGSPSTTTVTTPTTPVHTSNPVSAPPAKSGPSSIEKEEFLAEGGGDADGGDQEDGKVQIIGTSQPSAADKDAHKLLPGQHHLPHQKPPPGAKPVVPVESEEDPAAKKSTSTPTVPPVTTETSDDDSEVKHDMEIAAELERKEREAAKKREQEANDTPPPPKRMCDLYSSITSVSGSQLRTQYSMDSEEVDCMKPTYMRLTVSMFPLGTSSSAAAQALRCSYREVFLARQIEDAEETSKNGYSLTTQTLRADALIPGLDYYARLQACKAAPVSSDQESSYCRYVEGDSRPFHRPFSTDESPLSGTPFAVRLAIPVIKGKEQEEAFTRENVVQSVPLELITALRLHNDPFSSVSHLRFVSTITSDDFDVSYVQLDVLPPKVTNGGDNPYLISSSEPTASALAERIRCLLVPEGRSYLESTQILKLLSGVARASIYDPCAPQNFNANKEECVRVRASTSITPSSTDSIVSDPTKMSSSTSDDDLPPAFNEEDWKKRQAQQQQHQEADAKKSKDKTPPVKTPATTENPDDDSGELSEKSEEDLAAIAASANEESSSSTTIAEEQWYDQLFINPMYLMIIVGCILAVTFWALCIRGSSDRQAQRNDSPNVDEDGDDLELGSSNLNGQGVEMSSGKGGKSLGSHGGFSSLSNVDEDALNNSLSSSIGSSGGGSTSGSSNSSSSFSNEKEEGSASKFLISVLISIGIPSFGTTKYSQILKDNYLSTIEQLKQLDNSDWKRLGLPLVIEEAVRKTLQEHTNKEGRFASGGASGTNEKRAKGLDLKAAKKSPASSKDNKSKNKKGGLTVSALSDSPKDDDDPYADPVEPSVESDLLGSPSTASSTTEKETSSKKKKDKKQSLLLAPPDNDAQATGESKGEKKSDDLLDSWMDDF